MTTSARFRPLRPLAALIGLLGAAALVLGPVAPPVGAHEGDAVLTVEVHPAGQSIHYIVRVTWANDGHPATDATVTATAVAPDGTPLTPVPLAPADADGRYAGAVEYPAPGAWTVRITSINPTGTIEQPQEVIATATTAPNVTTGDATDGGFAPADDGTGASADESGDSADDAAQAPAADDTSGDDDGFPVLLVVAAAAVVLVGAVTAVNIIRRTRANPPAGPPTSGGTSAGGPSGDATAGSSPESTAAGAPSDTSSAG
jgi:hypothetical protein